MPFLWRAWSGVGLLVPWCSKVLYAERFGNFHLSPITLFHRKQKRKRKSPPIVSNLVRCLQSIYTQLENFAECHLGFAAHSEVFIGSDHIPPSFRVTHSIWWDSSTAFSLHYIVLAIYLLYAPSPCSHLLPPLLPLHSFLISTSPLSAA